MFTLRAIWWTLQKSHSLIPLAIVNKAVFIYKKCISKLIATLEVAPIPKLYTVQCTAVFIIYGLRTKRKSTKSLILSFDLCHTTSISK